MNPASSSCQRWLNRQHSWRHTSEGGFNRLAFDVSALGELAAKAFVEQHHYSGSYPAALQRYGLWLHEQLVGVAVLSVPAQAKVLTNVFPELEAYTESAELGRFVLLDEVPANAESWFLARIFELAAAQGTRGLVSFSDPQPRTSADGTTTLAGHVGTIYQATNARYTGRGTPRSLHLLPNGQVFNHRSEQKIRSGEKGHEYAEELLCSFGARPRRVREDRAAWLEKALRQARVRTYRHPGNHRYAFALGDKRQRRTVSIALPALAYPKAVPARGE